jgi:gliding motility-associated-like protein
MKYSLFFILLLTSILTIAQNKNQSIGFKENKGQIVDQNGKSNDAVKYLLNSRGLNVQLKKQGFSYDVYEIKKRIKKHHHQEQNSLVSLHNNKNLPDYILEYSFHRIDIDFVNANTNVELITDEASSDYDNYYNVPNKPEGITHVHQYKQITYKNIYPNIDVIFSIPKDTLKTVEYNFVVHPKGNIQDIQLKFSGVTTELNHETLLLKTRFGKMEETLPASWTEDGKCKNEIAVGYTKIKNNVYGFKSSENVFNKTVVIDPVPVRLWGTYYGGENFDFASSIFVKNSFVYLAGTTYSSNNIASSGAYRTYLSSLSGNYDSFLSKLNSDGTRVWGTYYGGEYADKINQVKVSNNDNIYVGGETLSKTNITTLGSHQQNNVDPIWNNYDGFLVKFDPDGVRQWGTYYGDLKDERINSLTIDLNEYIYISGETLSDKGIATIGSYQPIRVNQGPYPYDGFIAKFNPNGVREWGTYCGGNNRDGIFDSKLDSNGNLIFLGITNSTSGIATPNSYQEINNGNDGFLMKFDPNGNKIWGTYFGGNSDDFFYYLGIDASDNLYCFGQTISTTGIATSGVFQEVYRSNTITHNSGCIFKLNQNGFKTWGSYFFPETLGGSVSQTGNIYFTGRVEDGFLTTPNAYRETRYNDRGTESYIVKYNTNGQREWATYFGGEMADNAFITEVDSNSNIYLAGATNSTTNIATPNTYQPNLYPDTNFYTLNSYEAFLVKFKDCSSLATVSNNSPICGGTTLELKASGGTNYNWTGPNGFSSTLQNPIIPNTSISNSGQYSCAITGTGDCDSTLTTDVTIGDTNPPIPNITTLPTINGDCSTIILIPSATDSCDGLILATTSNSITNLSQGTHTIVWKYTDSNGNSTTQNQTVIISNQAISSVTSPQNFCIQQNVTLNNIIITGQNIKWYDALTNGNNLANTSLLQNGTTYYASQTINGCESDRVPISINIQTTATPSVDSNQIFCASQNPTLSSIQIAGTAIKWYDINGNDLTSTILLQNNQTYYATQTVNNCESSIKSTVTISLISSLPANNYSKSFCDNLNDATEAINLMDYNTNLIANTNDYSFNFYTTLIGAENQLSTAKITNPNNYNITLGENKVYVRINSNKPCFAIAELKLSLFPKPNILINDLMPICENSSVTINAGSNFTNYLWSTGATTPFIVITNPGDYSVLVSKDYSSISCSTNKNFSVKKSTLANITSIETKDWTDTNNSIIIYTTGTGDYEYSLDGIHYQVNNEFSNLANGKYTVSVRDKNGCGIVNDTVYLLMYPKFFTPNGDGFNDTWKIKFSNNENDIVIKIFDRYGKLIKELSQNNSWDGTYIGNQLPADDYWFTATRPNTDTEYKGHFSLKR